MTTDKLYSNYPQDKFDEFQEIHQKINERGYVLKGEAEILSNFESKYLLCSECKVPINKFVIRTEITFPDKHKQPLKIGFVGLCLSCFMGDVKKVSI